jgi:tetratricopeptide (TPR) repeat protein
LELSRALDDRENLSWGLGFRTTLEQMSGELSNGEADCREAVGLAETPFVRIFALHALGLARILRCDWSPAIEVLKEALLLLHESRTAAEQEPETLAWLAEAQNGAGLFDLARETARQAIEIARVLGTRISELEAHLALARTLLASDGAAAGDAVDAALNEAQIAAEECGARGFAPQIHVERGRLAAARGDDAARTRIFGEAHRLFTEIGATGHAQRLARELGSS